MSGGSDARVVFSKLGAADDSVISVGSPPPLKRVQWSPSGRYLLSENDKHLWLWDLEAKERDGEAYQISWRPIPKGARWYSGRRSARFVGPERLLLAERGQSRMYDVVNKQLLWRKAVHFSKEITVSPNKASIALQNGDEVRVFDTQTGEERTRFKARGAIRFASDSRLLAMDYRHRVAVFDVESQVLHHFMNPVSHIHDLHMVSPKGTYALYANRDEIELVKVENGHSLVKLSHPFKKSYFPEKKNNATTISPDEEYILAQSSNRTVILAPIRRFTAFQHEYRTEDNEVAQAGFTPDGRVYVLGNSGQLKVRPPYSPCCTSPHAPYEVRLSGAEYLSFSPSSERFAVVGKDGVVRIYRGDKQERELLGPYEPPEAAKDDGFIKIGERE
jgi:WD40 repeat protein